VTQSKRDILKSVLRGSEQVETDEDCRWKPLPGVGGHPASRDQIMIVHSL